MAKVVYLQQFSFQSQSQFLACCAIDYNVLSAHLAPLSLGEGSGERTKVIVEAKRIY